MEWWIDSHDGTSTLTFFGTGRCRSVSSTSRIRAAESERVPGAAVSSVVSVLPANVSSSVVVGAASALLS